MHDEDGFDNPQSAVDGIAIDAGYAELAAHALNQLRRAMARGQASVACGWMRLHERLSAHAEAERQAERRTTIDAEPSRRVLPPVPLERGPPGPLFSAPEGEPGGPRSRASSPTSRSLDTFLTGRASLDPNEPNTPHTFFTETEPARPPFLGNSP
ncbi:MAG: hypothetical protein V4701_01465 [Pseudomonadota bacterium]